MIGCEWPECAVPEKHRAECEDRECGGCRPRPSERGRLCAKHWSWLNRDLSMCAELVLQVRESMVRGPAAADGDRVRGGKTAPPAPLDVAAVDAADELFALLLSAGVAMSSDLGVAEPSTDGRWAVGGVVHGVPSTTSPESAARAVGRLVSWWRDHLDAIAGLPDVLDVGPELHEMVRVMRSRWPAAERPRHLPGTPCRECDLMDLWWTPPNGVGWPITVECHSCGYVAPEQDLRRLTHLVEYEQSKRKQKPQPRSLVKDWLTAEQVYSEFEISRTTLWRWRQRYVIREAHFTKRHPVMYNRGDLLIAARENSRKNDA